MQEHRCEEIKAKFLFNRENNKDELNKLSIDEIMYLLSSLKSAQKMVKIKNIDIDSKRTILIEVALSKLEMCDEFAVAFSKETNNPYIDDDDKCFICLDPTYIDEVYAMLQKKEISINMMNISKKQRRKYMQDIDRFGMKYLVINGTEVLIEDFVPNKETSKNEVDVKNPNLVSSILKFYQIKENGFCKIDKFRNYKKLKNEILHQIVKGKYIVPINANYNDEAKMNIVCVNDEEGGRWIPVFTDMIEYLKVYEGNENVTAKLLYYEDFLKFIEHVSGIIINGSSSYFLLDKPILIESEKLKDRKQISKLYGMNEDINLDMLEYDNYPTLKDIERVFIDEYKSAELSKKFLSNREIYLEEIEKLNVEELILLIFLATEIINKNGENNVNSDYKNVRAIFMEVLIGKINKCEKLYSLVSKITSYPYIDDEGRNWLFATKESARNMQMNLEDNGIKVDIAEISKTKKSRFFKELHRIGIEEVSIGNLKNCVIINKSILFTPTDWSKVKERNIPIVNPKLINSTIRFFEIVKSERNFASRGKMVEKLEKNMLKEILKAKFLVPMKLYEDKYYIDYKHENSKAVDLFEEEDEDDDDIYVEGNQARRKSLRKATMVSFAEICDTENKKWIPAFSDVTEFRKSYNEDEWGIKVLSYEDLTALSLDIEGIAVDFKGVNLSISKLIMNKITLLNEEIMREKRYKEEQNIINEIENTIQLPESREMFLAKIKEEEDKRERMEEISNIADKLKEIEELKSVLENAKDYLETIERNQPIMIEYETAMFKKKYKVKYANEFREYKEAEEALESMRIQNRSDYNKRINQCKRIEKELHIDKNKKILSNIEFINEMKNRYKSENRTFTEENYNNLIGLFCKNDSLKVYKIHKVFPEFVRK